MRLSVSIGMSLFSLIKIKTLMIVRRATHADAKFSLKNKSSHF